MDVISARNCRICLSQCEIRDLDVMEFASKFECTGFKITKDDIPKKICSTCTSELIITSNFLAKCEATETTLEKLWLKLMKESEKVKEEIILEEELEGVVEYIDENPDDIELMVVESCNDDDEEYEKALRFNCDYCEYSVGCCKKIYELKNHIQKCHADVVKVKKCIICSMTFSVQSLLEFHIKECHSENIVKDHITCTFCGTHSLRTEIIQRHVVSNHKNEEVFACIICQKPFYTMDHLRLHTKQSFCGTSIADESMIDCGLVLKCDHCAFSCVLEANMKHHVRKMHENVELTRCHCGSEKIYSKNLAAEHLKYKCNADRPCLNLHNAVKMGIPRRKPKVFKQDDGLTVEERKKMRQKETVECEFCHEKIKRASLQRHIKNLHRGIKHYCQFCDNTYTLLQNLKIHVAKHHMNKKSEFPCQYCARSFNTWASRYYHEIRIHTKNFKYKCQTCNRQFLHQADYDDHNTMHTGAKIRECDVCLEMFSTRDTLRTHKETKHRKDAPLTCPVCEKAFLRQKQLKKHVKDVHEKILTKMMMDDESDDFDYFDFE